MLRGRPLPSRRASARAGVGPASAAARRAIGARSPPSVRGLIIKCPWLPPASGRAKQEPRAPCSPSRAAAPGALPSRPHTCLLSLLQSASRGDPLFQQPAPSGQRHGEWLCPQVARHLRDCRPPVPSLHAFARHSPGSSLPGGSGSGSYTPTLSPKVPLSSREFQCSLQNLALCNRRPGREIGCPREDRTPSEG